VAPAQISCRAGFYLLFADAASRAAIAKISSMNRWLFKEEPTHFNYADLEKAGAVVWDGVANALALIHLRQCRRGDRVLLYQTGKEKAIVGEMVILKGPSTQDKSEKEVTVTVGPKRRFKNPVTLTTIKADPVFADWELVRLSRLSVMPVPAHLWARIEELAKSTD
jgi:predicted RNA-binding protein with PUA-like domain